MKKVFYFSFMLLIMVLCSCSNLNNDRLNSEVSIITPKGIPFLSIGGLLEEENLFIERVSGADNLQTALVSGSHDIVIAPINLGAKLYSLGKSQYKIAAVLTSNNAYIVTKEENKLDSINDLINEKVIAFGSTGIPGNILKLIYNQNDSLNTDDIDFSFSSSAEVYSVFAGNSTHSKYALMSEPETTKLKLKDNINVKKLDLCALLGVDVPQACVFINPNSINKDDINKVLNMIDENIKYLNEKPIDYAKKVINLDKTFELMGEEIIYSSIPYTNIEYKTAYESKEEIQNILSVLGVKLPDDEFYYQK